MIPTEYLREKDREPLPSWIAAIEAQADPFSKIKTLPADTPLLQNFFESRYGFYPGSGTDGHCVETFMAAHCVHCVLHLDYLLEREKDVLSKFHPNRQGLSFKGYDTIALFDINSPLRDTPPPARAGEFFRHRDRLPIEEREREQRLGRHFAPIAIPLCHFGDRSEVFLMLCIFERRSGFDALHGPKRFALLVGTADILRCYRHFRNRITGTPHPPHAIIIQNDAYGGYYAPFGAKGPLPEKAKNLGRLPRWLSTRDEPWPGYRRIPELPPWRETGQNLQVRHLHKLINDD